MERSGSWLKGVASPETRRTAHDDPVPAKQLGAALLAVRRLVVGERGVVVCRFGGARRWWSGVGSAGGRCRFGGWSGVGMPVVQVWDGRVSVVSCWRHVWAGLGGAVAAG